MVFLYDKGHSQRWEVKGVDDELLPLSQYIRVQDQYRYSTYSMNFIKNYAIHLRPLRVCVCYVPLSQLQLLVTL